MLASDQVAISIDNIAGQEIWKSTFGATTPHFSKQIDLDKTLPPGLYILTLTSGNYSATKRFIKN
ncbi:MAG TPA: T9SS type A sorting domain-containing protein [Flavipsychrobacter sp.]|nr:T9SS type A sorting domain-containing protein [Flavipsychrobacter sp.]